MRPTISIVIPVYNSEGYLRTCLDGVRRSTVEPHEVIVVDDGSTDGSRAVAEEFGAQVFETGGRCGPAKARNLGARQATGDVVYFIDADVVVARDAIGRIVADFAADPELAALMGSYDDQPGDPDFLSQYRNLMHHFVHQNARREACTFWSGCGAMRRDVFLEHDGFDESYDRPAIEDIELGARLHHAGRKMILDREIQVTHLKKWTFFGLLKADIFDRGIPWTELILRDRQMPNDLNLQLSQRVSVALAFLLTGMALFGTIYWGGAFLTPLFALMFLVLARFWGEAVSSRDSRKGIAWTGAIALSICGLLWAYDMVGMIPPLIMAYALLLMHHRYEYKDDRRKNYVKAAIILLFLVVGFLTVFYLPYHMFIFTAMLGAVVLIVLNNQFYLFLAAKKNRLFAVAAIPFHLLYHFYSGMSFIAGTAMYAFRSRETTPHRSADR